MKQYLMRTYDTCWNDVVREVIVKAVNDDTAIRIAQTSLDLFVSPNDKLEIQVCRKGVGMGEWCMFAAVYYCDGDIVVDDCFC